MYIKIAICTIIARSRSSGCEGMHVPTGDNVWRLGSSRSPFFCRDGDWCAGTKYFELPSFRNTSPLRVSHTPSHNKATLPLSFCTLRHIVSPKFQSFNCAIHLLMPLETLQVFCPRSLNSLNLKKSCTLPIFYPTCSNSR